MSLNYLSQLSWQVHIFKNGTIMKTVDVLISGSLDSPIGPTGTIKRLLKIRNT